MDTIGAFCNVKLFFIGKQFFTDLFRKLPLHREGLHYHFETNRKWRQIDWFSVGIDWFSVGIDWFSVGTFNVSKVDRKCIMVHNHTLPIQATFALFEWIMVFVCEDVFHSLCITFMTRGSFLFTLK
eukprot:scaffold189613_cov36-Cyclotella_meneghiniana.AAC.1